MTIEDEIPLEERYTRRARAAWNAAIALPRWEESGGSMQAWVARTEACGRIAAALIMSDREEKNE